MNISTSRQIKTYTLTFALLIGLLVATIALAHINLGPLNTAIGLLIAAAKAILVALFFMEIRSSTGIHRIAAAMGVFWLGILISLTLTDYVSRNWLLLPSYWP